MISERRIAKTADPAASNREVVTARAPISKVVQAQIQTKINTFINWDAQSYLRSRRVHKYVKQETKADEAANLMKTLLKFVDEMKRKQKLLKNRKHRQNEMEVASVTQNQRERFQKMSNPLEFIAYYTANHQFEPKQHQKILIGKMVQIKAFLESTESLHLDKVLSEIYELMNMIVDFNQLRLLVVIVVLAADICYQAKDFNRAVYFYAQSKLASEISGLPEITTESLIGLSKTCYDLGLCAFSIKFLKKALAYSWQQNDTVSEAQIYDILGQNYCLEGKMTEAMYYHERFIQNYSEKESSAVRKIYIEIVKDDAKSRNLRLYSQNLDLLFLETVSLPIWNFYRIPQFRINAQFDNFIEGQSPRRKLINKMFDFEHFQDAQSQLQALLSSPEFCKEMPNPNLQSLHTPSHRYGKKKRQVEFSRTVQFHEITHTKMETRPPEKAKKYSIEKQIQVLKSQKPDPDWFAKMSENVKRERLQKLGSLKDPVRKTHLKTQQRKRTLSTQSQNIRRSINKAILSWIDPFQ